MSVKISKINIYENNWQTTVYDPRTKNVVADVLSKGYRLWEVAYFRPYVFSVLRKDILSHFSFLRTQSACVYSEEEAFFVRELQAKISGFICKEVAYTFKWDMSRILAN